MRALRPLVLRLTIAGAGLLAGAAASAQESSAPANPSHTHIGHVADRFGDTPDNRGLLATALAEARVANEHVGIGLRDQSNLATMKTHARHVLNAIDPTAEAEGPGLDYGLAKATAAVIQHLEMAANAPGATQNVKTHTAHVVVALKNVQIWAEQIRPLVAETRAATEAWQAASAMSQIQILTSEILGGTDANADGRITWEAFVGGLRQVEPLVDLMKRGEGLGSTP